jgi:hypothetical protein
MTNHFPAARVATRALPAVVLLSSFFLAPGCVSDDGPTALVAANPFAHRPPAGPRVKASYTAAPVDVAIRVDGLGRKILAANRQIGVRPLFTAVGDPRPEIFHKATSEIVITTGLVEQCKTEGQLAAVLCNELGKMISEREALAGSPVPARLPPPPLELRVGNDNPGLVGSQDEMYKLQRAKFDKNYDRPRATLPPDPQVLARGYLTKAGYPAADLQAAAPLLQAAENNGSLENTMTGNTAGAGPR